MHCDIPCICSISSRIDTNSEARQLDEQLEEEGDEDDVDGEEDSWWATLLLFCLLGVCFQCALKYGSFFLFFDAFDLDRHG